MKTKTQRGWLVRVIKKHGMYFVEEYAPDGNLIAKLCDSMNEVIEYLNFNWPAGTQVQWLVKQ